MVKKLTKRELERRELQLKYGEICWYCGMDLKGREQHVDHIIPKSMGGRNHIDNYALTCEFCNHAKFANDLGHFLRWLCHVRSGLFECKILKNLTLAQVLKEIDISEYDRLNKDFGNAFIRKRRKS